MAFAIAGSLVGCKNSQTKSKSRPATELYSGESRPRGLGLLSETDTNQRMIECNKRGYTWIAVVDAGNKPSRCGEPLAEISCSMESIYQKYPDIRDDLQNKVYNMPGFNLFNCGKERDKLNLHFVLIRSNKLYYRMLSLPFRP